ncbi:hypothetical protein BH24ACT26_BH24ACT26_16750 [soil metagenome]
MEGGASKDTSGEERPNVLPLDEAEPNASTEETSESTLDFRAGASQPDGLPEKSDEPPVVQGTPARPVPRRKLYQDEIYGSKQVSEIAVALMDAPEFRRLAHIYQLGTTLNVFRGATHSSLDQLRRHILHVSHAHAESCANHARLYSTGRQCLRSSWLLDLSETVSARTGDEIVRPTFLLSRGRWRGLTELVSAAALLHDLGHVTATPWRTSFQSSEGHDGLGGSRQFIWRASAAELLDVPSCTGDKAQRRNARPMRALRPRIEKEKEIGEPV